MLTPEAVELFDRAVLCWLATTDGDARPSVSPKEVFAVVDTETILVADIASPRSVRNIRTQPQVCVAVIDVFAQHGYQAYGPARVIVEGDPEFEALAAPLRSIAGPLYPVRSVVRVRVERVSRILAPSLWMYPEMPEAERRSGVLRAYGVRDAVDLGASITEFGEAAQWVAELVASIPADAWDGPGLGDWNLRGLVGHTSRALLSIEQYLSVPAEVAEIDSPEGYHSAAARIPGADDAAVLRRGIDAGEALGDDPAAAVREIVARVTARLRGSDDALIRTIAGGMRLSDYLPTRTFELIVHGLDIASAADLAADPPAAPLERCLALAAAIGARTGTSTVMLRALTGRGGLPEGFSVLS